MFAEKAQGMIYPGQHQTNLFNYNGIFDGDYSRRGKNGKREHNEITLEMRNSTWDHHPDTTIQFCLRFTRD